VSIAASRREHAESLLKTYRDLWLATSCDSGPHLVPLSFVWHGERLLFATSAITRTGRNLLENGRARAAVGETRDLVIVEGSASPAHADDEALSQVFVNTLGFSHSDVGEGGTLFVLKPRAIQAWVERADTDRWVMRDGRWLS
jgi:nitroimidazol reductase NimA-like FMN-containing flavoprotein (pyridoxamine 5'-phosphate oxidase superfamily)